MDFYVNKVLYFRLDVNSQEHRTHKVVFAPILDNKRFRLDFLLLGTLSLFHLLQLLLLLEVLELLVGHHGVVDSSVCFVGDGQVEQASWIAVHPFTVNFN